MDRTSFSRRWWNLGLALALLLAALASGKYYLAARARALRAEEDLAVGAELIRRIKTLELAPVLAQAQTLQQPELAQRIEAAAKLANVASSSIERIVPESPRRLGESAYLENPAQVALRQVTLRQVMTFLHHLSQEASSAQPGLRVQSLRLVAPRGDESGDLWRVEVTVSYLVYSPQTTSNLRTGA